MFSPQFSNLMYEYAPQCAVCGQVTSSAHELLCSSCSFKRNQITKWPIVLSIIIRLVFVICIEMFFGILTGFVVLIPIGAASAPNVPWSTVLTLFVFNFIAIAPILASIYTWTLQKWIVRAQSWAIANTVGALLPGLCMFLFVIGGLRMTTLPEIVLTFLIVSIECSIGLGIAYWQCRYLTPPIQQQSLWFRWCLIGWSMGGIAHIIIAILWPSNGFSIWLGTAVSYTIYGTIAHCILAYFAFNQQVIKEMRISRLYID